VTEMQTLRRRRELVLLSAELQRVTLVRRLDNVQRHPIRTVAGLATSIASVPLLIKVGTLVARRVAGRSRKRHMTSTEKRRFSLLALLPLLRYVPAIKAVLPRLRNLNFNRR
jgi:hypothetical protein